MNFRFTEQRKDFSFIEQIGGLARTTLPKKSLIFLAMSFILLTIASCGGTGNTAASPTATQPSPPLPTPPQPPTTSNGHFRTLKSVIGTSSRSVHPLDGASSPTVSMTYARYSATATLLSDGRVLVAGGIDAQACEGFCNPSPTNYAGVFTAEVFDPSTETFGLLDSKMSWGRVNHCAVTLPDNRVALIGGVPMSWQSPVSWDLPPTVDIFDPATNTFTPQILSGPLPDTTVFHSVFCFRAIAF